MIMQKHNGLYAPSPPRLIMSSSAFARRMNGSQIRHASSNRIGQSSRFQKKASDVGHVCSAAKTETKVDEYIEKLLQEIQDSDRGNAGGSEQKQKILDAVESLEAISKDQKTTGPDVNATWKLLWTTEKETLFILKNASFFRTEAGDVFQVIDTNSGFLQNVITFKNGASFVVDSSLENAGEKRLVFKFSAARLNTKSRQWKIPPFGKGWFDTTFLGKDIRIARDIRGDTLIVKRDGPPRKF